jgi:hypothetical protein
MVTGVGTFAAIAAGLASWFLQPSEKADMAKLAEEVERLRQAVESRTLPQ